MIDTVSAEDIQKALINWIRWVGVKIVMPNVYITNSPWESDVVTVTSSYYWTEYEIKTSVADYRNDFRKNDTFGNRTFRDTIYKHEAYASSEEILSHGKIIPKPKEFFFVVPSGLLDDEEVPNHCGIIEYSENFRYWKVKSKRPAPRLKKATKLDQKAIFNLAQKASFRLTEKDEK